MDNNNYLNLLNANVADDTIVCDLFMDQVGLACVVAADEANLFAALEEGEKTSEQVAQASNRDFGAVDGLYRVLVSFGLLEKVGQLYRLSQVAESYFLKSSPTYRGYQFLGSKDTWAHKKVKGMLDEGWAPIGQDNKSFTEMWETGSLSQQAADRFTGMMHTNIAGPAIAIAKSGVFDNYDHIVDVGGGSGVFLAALAQKYADKQLTLMELPQVCNSAKKIVEKYDSATRLNFHGANFFENNWPNGANAFFLSNILHDWPLEKGATILKNAFQALEPGGAIFVSECLLNEDKVSPKHTVIFDLMMYMNHRSHQYTKSEIYSLLQEVGFSGPEVVYKHGYYSVVRAIKS